MPSINKIYLENTYVSVSTDDIFGFRFSRYNSLFFTGTWMRVISAVKIRRYAWDVTSQTHRPAFKRGRNSYESNVIIIKTELFQLHE